MEGGEGGAAAPQGSLARDLEDVSEDGHLVRGPVGGASEGSDRGDWEVGNGGGGRDGGGEARGLRDITPPSKASGKVQILKSSLFSGFVWCVY
jgi:hypothetical protein